MRKRSKDVVSSWWKLRKPNNFYWKKVDEILEKTWTSESFASEKQNYELKTFRELLFTLVHDCQFLLLSGHGTNVRDIEDKLILQKDLHRT